MTDNDNRTNISDSTSESESIKSADSQAGTAYQAQSDTEGTQKAEDPTENAPKTQAPAGDAPQMQNSTGNAPTGNTAYHQAPSSNGNSEGTPSYSYDATKADPSSYSLKGSQIYQSKTYYAPSAYELSYDSRSGQYTHTQYQGQGYGPINNQNAPYTPQGDNSKKERKGASKGFVIAVMCVCLALSCVFGLASGALISLYLSESGVINRGTVYSEDASIKVSYAPSEETPVVTATSIAKETVVVIDVYTSSTMQSTQKIGSGSGVIWTENGYIVTCNHVIDGGSLIVVTLYSGDKYEATVIGRDPKTDLAVIKVEPGEGEKLSSATLRATDIVLGETVLAIGNPLGSLSNTVTEGIISCLERQITVEGQTMTLMQTSAAVNPGNSGGGLFDTNGSLVGIVNAKSSEDSVEGIGFAIPIATAINIATDLIENGYVTGRPSLGFESVYIDSSNYEQYPALHDYAITGTWLLKINPGVYVTDTQGVAGYESKTELQFGDKITQIGSTRITTRDDMVSALSKYSVGDTVEITVSRKKQTVTIKLILGEAGAG